MWLCYTWAFGPGDLFECDCRVATIELQVRPDFASSATSLDIGDNPWFPKGYPSVTLSRWS
ncbi:hypothetical protein AX27061_3883 [Achromobacter xylosoxidans NBRC 15126 = ATCC 27061]|nr:hypothetical protein AX27061_3883 [Achromobacter xylosoxidans NBRC 15126 = ATCC 27061]CCH09566.1 hypothetical protein NH44784_056241 [Achromobacter xylosoxidans NH44784-1996]